MTPATPTPRSARRSSSDPTPPDATTGRAAARSDRGEAVDIRPGQHAVASDLGHDHRGRTMGRGRSHQVDKPRARVLEPAAHPHVAVAVVEADGDAAGMAGSQSFDEVGALDGCSTDHDSTHAEAEERVRDVVVAHTTAALHRRPDGTHDRGHRLTVVASTACGVEVDDVDPRRAGGLELLRHGHWVVVVGGLLLEVALCQPHDPPVAHIDGRVEIHRAQPRQHASTKLRSSCSPADPDFSGWNCVAHTLPRSTAATTGPP